MEQTFEVEQYKSRIDFNNPKWEIKYLFNFISSISSNLTGVFDGKNFNLLPHKSELEKALTFSERIDLSVEFLALGVEDTITLRGIEEMLKNPKNFKLTVSSEYNDLDILGLLKNRLQEIQKKLKQARLKIPVNVMGILIMDSINPITPGPIPLLTLPAIKSLFTLSFSYSKQIKKIEEMIELLNNKKLNIKREKGLKQVEFLLKKSKFQKALQQTDDLDGIEGNQEYTDEMLSLAEFIQIQEKHQKEPDSLRSRIKILLSTSFYKKLASKKRTSIIQKKVIKIIYT